jgi:alkylation response protein AidB-like acyl-CoA dehydrogenase
MANFFSDNEDLQFYVQQGIDWGDLVELTERGFKSPDAPKSVGEAVDTYRDILEMVGEFAAEEMAPVAGAIDEEGVHLRDGEAVIPKAQKKIYDRMSQLDLHWLCVPRELGGMNAPLITYYMVLEIMSRADVSTMSHFGFHGGIAMALLVSSIREGTTTYDRETGSIAKTRFEDAIREIGKGLASGTMDITEPNAGSDMAALSSFGEQDEDGNWYVTGEKIFITSGHGKWHFVIARTEKAKDPNDPFAGLAGLSMFLVQAYDDLPDGSRKRWVTVERIEEKMGHHGSVTASLRFDRSPAHLIGQRGEGFKYMLLLMNGARLGVGYESIGLCEAAYRLARSYAAERPSMGKTIDKHELIADYLDTMHLEIQGMRALAMWGAHHEELAQKLDLAVRLDGARDEVERKRFERELKHHQAKSRRATPLLKYIAAEKAVEMARTCMQIHGGNGYMKEYGAERLLRDALVMPIYEGTSQIQALMVVKDTLGAIVRKPQDFVQRMAQTRWRSLSAKDALERRVAKLQLLELDAQQVLVRRTATDKIRSLQDRPWTEWSSALRKDWNPKRDFAHAMLHAERLTKIAVDVLIAEILLEQTQRHPERRNVLDRWLEKAEPRVRFHLDEIVHTGARLLARLDKEDSFDDIASR